MSSTDGDRQAIIVDVENDDGGCARRWRRRLRFQMFERVATAASTARFLYVSAEAASSRRSSSHFLFWRATDHNLGVCVRIVERVTAIWRVRKQF